jgi:hypothetical protein
LNPDFRDMLFALSDEGVELSNKLASGRPKDLADAAWLQSSPDAPPGGDRAARQE